MTTPVFAPAVTPSALSWLGIARESLPGVPVLPTAVVPVAGGSSEPEDTLQFIRDENLRADMSALYGAILGVQVATFTFGGPVFPDSVGYLLDNLFGDLSTMALAVGGPAAALAQPANTGDTVLYASASIGSVSTGSAVQIGDGAASEVVIATAGSSGTVIHCVGTPCRFGHPVTATLTLLSSVTNYTHTFAALNSGTGQPPTHTLTDFTGLTPATGARCYPAAMITQLDLTGTATGLLAIKAAGAAWLSAPAAAAPTITAPATIPLTAWQSTVALGGTQLLNVGAWTVSFKRAMIPYWSAGGLNPYVLARGGLTVTGGLSYTVAADDTPLTNMTAAGPLPLSIQVSNGVTGAGAVAVAVTCSQTQAMKAKLNRSTVVTGWDDDWESIANSTDVGGSGPNGPGTVTVTNGVATY